MKLYHGSNMRVEKPDLQRSKPFKDFGQGFYLSDNYKQAEDLAIVKVEQIKMMKDELTVKLADWLMSTYGYSPSEALDVLIPPRPLNDCRTQPLVFIFRVLAMCLLF